jgi:transposase
MGYRTYNQSQMLLLPPSLDELIPEKDLCRVVNDFVEGLPVSVVEETFKYEGGRPPYHPRMMLKVLLYAYSQNIRSSRVIAKNLRQNVCFMWLSAMGHPDHNTCNRFRSKYLKDVLDKVFGVLCGLLLSQGYIRGEDYFVDGSKFEADAGRHSYVWRSNVKRFKERVQQRAKEILEEIDRLNEEEDAYYEGLDLPEVGESSELTSAQIKRAAKSVEKKMGDDKKTKGALKRLKKEGENLSKYEEQEQILGSRNSYSKTDPDATFMKMKDGQIRAAYNVQIGTENGFVTGVSVSQTSNDGAVLIDHLETRDQVGVPQPKRVIADSAYGNEQNYSYLEGRGIEGYVKYPSWEKESRGEVGPYKKESFHYDKNSDSFVCPQGKQLLCVDKREYVFQTGYVANKNIYECTSCARCSVKDQCSPKSVNRTLTHSTKLEQYRQEARERLNSPLGYILRKRRCCEPEPFFGDAKHNRNYRRIGLRGTHKAMSELMWLSLSFNLKKMANMMGKKTKGDIVGKKDKKVLPNSIFSQCFQQIIYWTQTSQFMSCDVYADFMDNLIKIPIKDDF